MADKIVQLQDNSGDNIFPVVQNPISITDTDPGEGATLAANTYLAVYSVAAALINTSDIANKAVTEDKIDMDVMPGLVTDADIIADGFAIGFNVRNFSNIYISDSRYAANNGGKIQLQPGLYMIIMSARWDDTTTGSRFLGFTFDGTENDAPCWGNWEAHARTRLTSQVVKVREVSSVVNLQVLAYTDTAGSQLTAGRIEILRINRSRA